MFKKYIVYPIQFLLFLFIYYFFRTLPNKHASNFGGKLFQYLGPLTRIHKITLKNISYVFDKNSDSKNSLIAKKSWENLGRTVAELSHLSEITDVRNGNLIINDNGHIDKIIKNDEVVMFIAIHQSNWEILAPVLTNSGIKLNSVYRHINNFFIDRFILNIRKKAYNSTQSILSPKGKKSAQDLISSIKKKLSIALLVDQKDSAGINVPLLGKLAKTQTGFIKLAKKYNLKIYPIENNRLNNTNFELIIHNPLEFFINDNKIEEKEAIYHIHEIIGNWIKKNPENWLWQHKRWS